MWDTSRLSEGVIVVKGIDTGMGDTARLKNKESADKVYDLNGRQMPVDKGQKPKAGIYVRGGKKVVVR